jgi:hypothetical protein
VGVLEDHKQRVALAQGSTESNHILEQSPLFGFWFERRVWGNITVEGKKFGG